MATDDNFSGRVRPPASAKSNILAMLDGDGEVLTREKVGKPAATATPGLDGFGELTLLPGVGDPYVAHARPGNGPEEILYCIDAEGYWQAFVWSLFERSRLEKPERPGGGPVLVLRFHGSEVTEVAIEGQSLEAMGVYLGERRVKWIRLLGEGKAFGLVGGEAVITRMTIRKIER